MNQDNEAITAEVAEHFANEQADAWEDLMQEITEVAAEVETAAAVEPEAERDVLDDLLNESMYAYQASVKSRKGQRLTSNEREVLDYQNVELNWRKLAIVAQVENRTCSCCGSLHSILIGWYKIMQHRADPTAKRLCRITHWTAEDKADLLHLPVRKNYIAKQVDTCGDCLPVSTLPTQEEYLAWGLGTLA